MATDASNPVQQNDQQQGDAVPPQAAGAPVKRGSLMMTGMSLQIPADLYDDLSDDDEDEDDEAFGAEQPVLDDGKRAYQGGFAAAAYEALRADHLKKQAKQKAEAERMEKEKAKSSSTPSSSSEKKH